MIPDALASIFRVGVETSNSISGAVPHSFKGSWQGGCLTSQLIITPDGSNGGHLLEALSKRICAGSLMLGIVYTIGARSTDLHQIYLLRSDTN